MSVAITGLGLWTGLGRGVEANRRAQAEGRSAQAPAPELAPEEPVPPWASRVDRRALEGEDDPSSELARLALAAAREALEGSSPAPRVRTALVFGCATGSLARRSLAHDRENPHFKKDFLDSLASAAADEVAQALGLEGPRLVISTACTSSLQAILVGRALLAAGLVDRVLAGGAELVEPSTFAGFRRLGASSAGPCCPFSSPPGMALGEGAAFLVLEREEEAARRGAPILGHALGGGMSAETWHATAPHPRGVGMIAALRAALEDAGLAPEAVGFLDAQGTGTEANDQAEALAIEAVFGAVPVGASKSRIGHTLGAAGATEAALTLLALRDGSLPSIAGFGAPRRVVPAGVLAGPGPLPTRARVAVKNTAAFGGANAALVLGLDAGPPLACPRPPLGLRSWAILGPGGRGLPGEPAMGLVPEAILEGRADLRALRRDRAGGLLSVAVGEALSLAGERREPGERMGLICGVSDWPGRAGNAWFRAFSQEEGPRGGARDFSATVRNAAAGTACRERGITGPTLTLSCGEGAGLQAVVTAVLTLWSTPPLEGLVVAGLDEPCAEGLLHLREPGAGRIELAAAATLGRARAGDRARILGVGLGAPGRAGASEAVLAALAQAALAPGELAAAVLDGDREFLRSVLDELGLGALPFAHLAARLGPLEGAAGPAALALGLVALQEGGPVLLLGSGPRAGASTVILGPAT